MRLHVPGLRHDRLTVVEDHQRRRFRGVVLRRDIDPVGVLRAGEDLAGKHLRFGKFPLRHTVLRFRVAAELVEPVVRLVRRRPRRPGGGGRRGLGECGSGEQTEQEKGFFHNGCCAQNRRRRRLLATNI